MPSLDLQDATVQFSRKQTRDLHGNSLGCMMFVSVMQQNVNSQIAASYILEREARLSEVDILLVQEPYVSPISSFGLSSYHRAVFRSSAKRKPKAVTIIRNKFINSIAIPENSHWLSGVIVTVCNSQLVILNVYLAPSTAIRSQLNTLSKVILNYSRYPTVLAGDFNCRSVRFGDVKCNARGRELEAFVERHSLAIIGSNSEPTHLNHNGFGRSCIDLTFVNNKAAKMDLVTNWSIKSAHCTTSDHRLIQFRLSVQRDTRRGIDENETTALQSAMYSNLSTEDLCNVLHRADLNLSPADFQDASTAIETVIAKMQAAIFATQKHRRNISPYKSTNEFWNAELDEYRSQVQKARRRYQLAIKSNSDSTGPKSLYNSLLRVYRRLIVRAKRKTWVDLCERSVEWSMPFKFAIDKLRHKTEIDYFTCDGVVITEPDQICTVVKRRFFPSDNTDCETTSQMLLRSSLAERYDVSDCIPVDNYEIRTAIYRLHPNKAPGLDGLTMKYIRALWITNSVTLKMIINDIIRSGVFPQTLKSSKLILIRKPGKNDNDIKSFRPVSLVPALSKVLEQIIFDRLLHHMRENGHLCANQYGFIKGRSTTDMLCDIAECIQANRAKKLKTALVSLDIQGAFDNAWHCSILNALEGMKVPGYLVSLIKTYLHARTAIVNIHGKDFCIETKRGCPQGSVLGPILWNTNITSILNKQRESTKIYAYADDFVVVITSESIAELMRGIEHQVRDIRNDLHSIKLTLSVDKTKFMVIDKFSSRNTLSLNDNTIPTSKSLQVLGVILDYRLSFTEHLASQVQKATLLLKRMRCLASNKHGAVYQQLKLLYHTCVIPKISYASPVWFPALNKKGNIRKLQTLARQYNIFITKSYRTVSMQASSILAATMPLKFVIKEDAIRYHETRTYSFARGCLAADLDRVPKITYSTVDTVPWSKPFSTCSNARVCSDTIQRIYVINRVRGADVVSLICAIDNSGVVRSSVFILNDCLNGLEREMICTVLAIKHFARDPTAAHTTEQTFSALYVEQPLVVRLLLNGRSGKHIVNNIRELMISRQVIVACCPSSIPVAVRRTVDDKFRTNDVFRVTDLCSNRLVKHNSYLMALRQWNSEWIAYDGAQTTKAIFPTVESRLKCSTTIDFYLSQIISSHGNFRSYLFRFNCSDTSLCACGSGSEETVAHVLTDCCRFAPERRAFFAQAGINELSLAKIPDILSCKDKAVHFRAFTRFILTRKEQRSVDEILGSFDHKTFLQVSRLLNADRGLQNQAPGEINAHDVGGQDSDDEDSTDE